ncbi:sulfur reductase DrsE [Acidianus sulfidivorans JP7]|uniref:Sulfur reductase DrsE n=1 Tax=Acidianus sulfidivorans JP7 TaxID=619593 RepID=A0A2U9IKF4_9CREN|nr:DsrE family protein [Acidianus sulfidivorans]AWR96414.1 sulfur reductase DrsE [Acidianus sulfidivorans JP7]
MYKVVVQVKDLDRVPQALKSILNLYNDLKDAEIEVVFHQSAIKALINGYSLQDDIADLIKKGIIIVGCLNSIKAQNIDANTLIPGIKIVKAGVGEIVRKQSEGWIYLSL